MKKTGREVSCSFCGKEVYVPKWKLERHNNFYCDKECKDNHEKQTKKAENNPNAKGEYRDCILCGEKYWKSPSRDRKFCSKDCADEYRRITKPLSEERKGENNPNWKGGVSDDFYKRIAKENLEEKCIACGSEGDLDIHHKNGDHEDNRLDNLEFRCRSCHMKEHNRNSELNSISG